MQNYIKESSIFHPVERHSLQINPVGRKIGPKEEDKESEN